MNLCTVVGDTLAHGSIESRTGNFPVFRGDAETEEFAKVGVREMRSECQEDLGALVA